MTKQIYKRLLKYREPRKIDPKDEILSESGYLLINPAAIPPTFSLSNRAKIEMAECEEQMGRDAKQSRVNWTLIIIGALTLIATVAGIVFR